MDGVFIGPADLSASMGYAGAPNHPEVKRAGRGCYHTHC
ncbi:aldolase/citrate lyase family protein [Pseudomonas asiatica]